MSYTTILQRSLGTLALVLAMTTSAKSQTTITSPTDNPVWSPNAPHAVVFTFPTGNSAVVVRCLNKAIPTTEYSSQGFGPQTNSPVSLTLTNFGQTAPSPAVTQCLLRVDIYGTMGTKIGTAEVDVQITNGP